MPRIPFKRITKGTLLLLALLGLAASGAVLWPQLRPTAAPVGLAVDLRRLATVAQRDGLPWPTTLQQLRTNGIDAVVVQEQTLADFVAAGEVQIRWGWELLAQWRATGRHNLAATVAGPTGTGPYLGAFAPWRLFILPANDQVGRWVTAALNQRWPGQVEPLAVSAAGPWLGVSVPRNNPFNIMQRKQAFHRYEFPVDDAEQQLRHLLELPLGFWAPGLDGAVAAGFHVTPQLSGTAVTAGEPREVLGPTAALPPGTLLLMTTPPPPALVDAWSDFIGQAGWRLGLRTSQDAAPWQPLARAIGGEVVRVHPVWPEESAAGLVGRVVAGRTDILLFQWFMSLTGRTDDPANLDADTFDEIRAALAAVGRRQGWPLSSLAAGHPGHSARATGGLLATILGGGAILAAVIMVPGLAVAAGSWVAGQLFWPDAGQGGWGTPTAGWGQPVAIHRAVAGVLVASGLSLGGGLMLAAIQASPLLHSGIIRSRIIDLAPGAALAACAIAAVTLGHRRGASGRDGPVGVGGGVLRVAITFGLLVALAAVGLLTVLFVMRGAGLPLGPAGPGGAGAGLAQLLLVPPNPTLELLLTVPALLAALALKPAADPGWRAALLMTGVVGQASLLAAVARVQVPIATALTAAVQGLAGGLVLALGLWWLGATVAPRLRLAPSADGASAGSGGSLR